MGTSDAELRAALLAAAEAQLIAADGGEIATRAVCETVGVTQPVLYRLFGDKRGLLDALAEVGLERYAAQKAAVTGSSDPVADLRAGWEHHLAFAAEHAALYRLMFAPRPWASGAARAGVMALLQETLRRCEAAGRLRIEVRDAASMLLAASIGAAMERLADPSAFTVGAADGLRDAVIERVVTDAPVTAAGTVSLRRQLRAELLMDPPTALAPEERALLGLWLDRII